MTHPTPVYQTLEDIQRRKAELSEALATHRERVNSLWQDLVTPQKGASRGEVVASVVGHCITAFDAFMLIRKLSRQYGHLFHHSEGKKKHKK